MRLKYNPFWQIRYAWKSLKNICRWIPVLWKDRDWDQSFIFDILKFKLQNQADYIGSNDRHVGAQNDAKWMRTCCRLIEKVSSEFYETEYMEDYDWSKKLSDDQKEDIHKNYLKRYPKQHKLVLDKIKKKEKIANWYVSKDESDLEDQRLIALLVAAVNHRRAKRLLFNLLNNYIEYWWD